MKRIKLNYHALQVLRAAKPKLRKAIISNCDRELVHPMSECILNVLKGNVKLSHCAKRKLRKHKATLRKVADEHLSLARKKKVIVQRGGFLLPLLGAVLPTLASLIFRQRNAT
jgi:hypothetical protein